MADDVQFQRVNAYCDRRSGVFPFLVIRCSTCQRTAKTAEDPARPIGMSRACRAFAGAGWRVAAQRSADQCPQCVAGLTKSPKRSAKPIAKPKSQPMTASPSVAPAITAAPPRQPTREDRRRIQSALDEAYDDEAGCYRGSGSDRAIAERLDIPRAWVSEERERAYGPDRCESDAQDLAKVQLISQLAAILETRAMEIAAEAEALRKDAETMRARLAARGVQ